MPDQIEAENSELFIELSEQELEVVAGGHSHKHHSGLPTRSNNFFFQQTNIQSFASNKTYISTDGVSSSQEAGYIFSQTTIASGPLDNVLEGLIASIDPGITGTGRGGR